MFHWSTIEIDLNADFIDLNEWLATYLTWLNIISSKQMFAFDFLDFPWKAQSEGKHLRNWDRNVRIAFHYSSEAFHRYNDGHSMPSSIQTTSDSRRDYTRFRFQFGTWWKKSDQISISNFRSQNVFLDEKLEILLKIWFPSNRIFNM